MRSIQDLLHLLHSDGADRLMLCVGKPPVMVLDGEAQALEQQALTMEEASEFLQCLANSRQRRALLESGSVEFIYTFRDRVRFVVQARLARENIEINIH